jgi:osmotically-inducible protein OsmY
MTTSGSRRIAAHTDRPTDEAILHDVQEQLDRTADLDASAITVSVDHGIARLDGDVNCLADDTSARNATFRAQGIAAAVDRLGIAPSR